MQMSLVGQLELLPGQPWSPNEHPFVQCKSTQLDTGIFWLPAVDHGAGDTDVTNRLVRCIW